MTSVSSAPGETHRLRTFAFGDAKYRTCRITRTSSSITGHLPYCHAVTATSPRPERVADRGRRAGPETTSASAVTATSEMQMNVTSSWSGLSFQNGRPSSTS